MSIYSVVLFLQYNSPFGKAEAYEKQEQLGEGSYATVFKGRSLWVFSSDVTFCSAPKQFWSLVKLLNLLVITQPMALLCKYIAYVLVFQLHWKS